jgi:hypothetical protein
VASRHFARGQKLQYLVKWKGYPDVENQWVAKEDVFAEEAIKEFYNLNSDPGVHIRRAQTDLDSHPPSSECPLPGLSLAPSLRIYSTSTLVNPSITSNSEYSATSLISTEGNTPASVGSRVASTITTTKPMITPEVPYAPPFRPSANTPTPMTPSAVQTSPPLKKKSALAMPFPEPWGLPLLQPTTSQGGTQSSPSLLMGPPSPETNLMMLCDASLL